MDYPKDKCIHQLFEEQVERTPDAIAIRFEEEQLTYQELNARANQLAHYLQSLGVGSASASNATTLVGLCVERSIEMMVGILGILKTGGAYVPLDTAYPPKRLASMLVDAQVPLLLPQECLVADLPSLDAQIIFLDRDWPAILSLSRSNPARRVMSDNLAYVIYTSGSTGQPKGSDIPSLGRQLPDGDAPWEH